MIASEKKKIDDIAWEMYQTTSKLDQELEAVDPDDLELCGLFYCAKETVKDLYRLRDELLEIIK